jgi:hypothetical protein
MIIYSKYAEKKFDILNKYKVFFTKEQLEEVLKNPESIKIKGKYAHYKKDKIKVIVLKQENINKIITFFPIKK